MTLSLNQHENMDQDSQIDSNRQHMRDSSPKMDSEFQILNQIKEEVKDKDTTEKRNKRIIQLNLQQQANKEASKSANNVTGIQLQSKLTGNKSGI